MISAAALAARSFERRRPRAQTLASGVRASAPMPLKGDLSPPLISFGDGGEDLEVVGTVLFAKTCVSPFSSNP